MPTTVSIVTISFNQERFVLDAIRSVLSQPDRLAEYVIVDPGSTDRSPELYPRDHSRVTVLEGPDAGPADGLNKGFSYCSGDVFGFVNSDDYLMPGALAAVGSFFDRTPQADVLLGNGWLVNELGAPLRHVRPTRFSPLLYAYGAAHFLQQSCFFRRQAFEAVGGFNAANHVVWDAELLLDMAVSGSSVARLNADLGCFRLHGASITGSQRLAQLYRSEQDRLFAKVVGRAPKPVDRVARKLAGRPGKWMLNPGATLERARDQFSGRGTARLP